MPVYVRERCVLFIPEYIQLTVSYPICIHLATNSVDSPSNGDCFIFVTRNYCIPCIVLFFVFAAQQLLRTGKIPTGKVLS